jgi:AMP phosphorylase
MSVYLKSRNLDLGEDNSFNIVLHREDAERIGVKEGELLYVGINDVDLYANIIETEDKVREGEIGLFEEIWKTYKVKQGSTIFVDIPERSKALAAISKKLLGHDLNKSELELIMNDIASRRLRETEIAFFISTFFNPGFNEDEIYWMTQAMAQSGDILSFKDIKGKGSVIADKHSIGGVAGKGVTPVLVPILAAGGLVVPNTSSRAITAPSGTADILEVIMPVSLGKKEILETVRKTGACLIWGGSLSISPADDVIVNVERSLRIQEYQKILVSIVAKKVSLGIEHILIDLPYGKGSKIERTEDVFILEREFKKLFKKFGIECETTTRKVKGPDGRGVGPSLEIREVLRILERTSDAPLDVEEVAIEMAGKLFESTKTVEEGQGKIFAQDILDSRKAYKKFWEIAQAQGAKQIIKSSDIKIGDLSYNVISKQSGMVKMINNIEIVNIARALGAPKIKEAGLYIHKMPGEKVEKGDHLFTIYATSEDRLENGKKAVNLEKMYEIE